MAQLIEQSLLIPEVRSSNPVMVNLLNKPIYCQLYWKDENKEKEAGNRHFLMLVPTYTSLFKTIILIEEITFLLASSVTRLGDLLDFGQLFDAFGNNSYHFSSEIIFGQLL